MTGNSFALMPDKKPLKIPRDYQDKAFPALIEWFETKDGFPLVVIPTGGGKSLIMAELMRKCFEIDASTRFLVLSHVGELQIQNAKAFSGQCPNIHFSFYSDKLGQKDLSGQVIFATIQSIHKKAYKIHSPAIDIIIIDECHLIPHSGEGMYRKFINDMIKTNPLIKCIGYSATPFRAKTGLLYKGDGALFGGVAYEVEVLDLINRGFLSPILTPTMEMRMSTEGVPIQGGDFVAKHLEKKIDKEEITRACVDEILQYSHGRNKWLIFTAGIEHCTHVRDEIRGRGIACEMVTGKTPTGERNRIIEWHKQKTSEPRCLVNVSVLTTGYDNPAIDLIAFMRPTRSPVLYVQMIGRAMRIYEGKTDAICLDFGNIINTLGPVDKIRLPTKKKGDGEAPSKICPQCEEKNHAAARVCIQCGFEFPLPEPKIEHRASDAAVLSNQLKVESYSVTGVKYCRHKKSGKPDTLRVDYESGILKTFSKWLCFSHTGAPREMACFWWRKNAGTPPPKNTDEALTRTKEIKMPKKIYAKKIGKYYEIIGEEL